MTNGDMGGFLRHGGTPKLSNVAKLSHNDINIGTSKKYTYSYRYIHVYIDRYSLGYDIAVLFRFRYVLSHYC